MTEARVPSMKEARTVGRSMSEVPSEWLPVRVGPWPNAVCGWWLCVNKRDGYGRGSLSGGVHVLYCSLPYGHDGGCVWQNPTPKMPKATDPADKGSDETRHGGQQ